MAKPVTLRDDTYAELCVIKGELTIKRKKPVSISDTVKYLIHELKRKKEES